MLNFNANNDVDANATIECEQAFRITCNKTYVRRRPPPNIVCNIDIQLFLGKFVLNFKIHQSSFRGEFPECLAWFLCWGISIQSSRVLFVMLFSSSSGTQWGAEADTLQTDLQCNKRILPLLQESPPAWTQEAYRPPCSEYSFCCPTRVPPPPGGGGVPDPGTPPGGGVRVPPWGRGVPDPGTPRGGTWPGYPPGGLGTPPGGYLTRVPPRGVPDPGTPRGGPGYTPGGGGGGVPDPGTPPGGIQVPSPRCLMAFWEMLQSIMGYGYPPLWTDRIMDGQTRVKTLPSPILRMRAVTRNSNSLFLLPQNPVGDCWLVSLLKSVIQVAFQLQMRYYFLFKKAAKLKLVGFRK